jgi:hypothetical protein
MLSAPATVTRYSLSQIATTDFPWRMRNKMAADLRPNEVVIDDDYVGISRGRQLGKRAAGRSLPQFGLAVVTTERLRIATADDEGVTDVRLEAVRLTQDNVLTMTVRKPGGPTEPLTLVFPKRRSPVAQFLRQTTLEGGPSAKGFATPALRNENDSRRSRADSCPIRSVGQRSPGETTIKASCPIGGPQSDARVRMAELAWPDLGSLICVVRIDSQ